MARAVLSAALPTLEKPAQSRGNRVSGSPWPRLARASCRLVSARGAVCPAGGPVGVSTRRRAGAVQDMRADAGAGAGRRRAMGSLRGRSCGTGSISRAAWPAGRGVSSVGAAVGVEGGQRAGDGLLTALAAGVRRNRRRRDPGAIGRSGDGRGGAPVGLGDGFAGGLLRGLPGLVEDAHRRPPFVVCVGTTTGSGCRWWPHRGRWLIPRQGPRCAPTSAASVTTALV
jgi:hypothetical protein